ncbi:MAG: transporter substrate-binding domain-containing protein [Thermoanaerobaculales bacterium]|nr:transporter substrate-binding domain-containing protein [Thermoanaerobaculales bacterium]
MIRAFRAGSGSADRRCSAFLALLGVAVAALSGCTERSTGGLEAVRQRGTLRVAVPPGFDSTSGAAARGAEDLNQVEHLSARLGVDVRWVEVDRYRDLIPAVVEGRADVAVGRLSPSVLIGTGLVASSPVEWVDEFIVTQGKMPQLELDHLRGGSVELRLSDLSPAVSDALRGLDIQVVALAEDLTASEVLAAVAAGSIPATVMDSGLLERVGNGGSIQLLGPVVERRPVVWAVRERNLQLRRAIDDFLFAEQVLTRQTRARVCRDLDGIRRARVLRVVTRNSPTTCFVSRGGLEGFEYELAVAFARTLRLRLELSIPPPGVDPLDWLEQGFGDLAVLHEPADPEHEGRFAISKPYRHVDFVSVLSRHLDPHVGFTDLAGLRLAASRSVAGWVLNYPLQPPLVRTGKGKDIDAFGALRAVSRGEADLAVVDADAVELEIDGGRELVVGPTVLKDVPLVWVMNTSSPRLRREVDAFLLTARSSGEVSQLLLKNLGRWKLYVSPRMPDVPSGDLTPYDEYLTWAARKHGLDWRLLASLMYEESRFDPDAVGPGGSAGLFQFMPFTWRELGVEDPHHPGEAIEAGARYLDSLMDKFGDLELPDRVAMAIASYNVGPRHVFDARRLADAMNLDPNRWADNVETAMYILDDPEVARQYPAGVCRCRRGAAYTRRILRRYAAYTEQFPPA